MVFEPGRTIDSYRLLATAGSGGCSEVFETIYEGQRVALKALLSGADDFIRGLFIQEGEILQRYNGRPHYPRLLGRGEAEGRPYIVLEWVDRVGARGALSVGQKINLLSEMCDALSTAHSDGITHRDIHPSNFKLGSRGEGKLIDWGVAHVPGSALTPMPERLTGTYSTMSPEAFQGAFGDPRGDLYGIGCCLCLYLTGTLPFGETGGQKALEGLHRKSPIPQLAKFKASTNDPPEYQDMLDRLLAKDPGARIGSAVEVRDRLRSLRRLGR